MTKKSTMLSKTLTIGVIVLFIIISLIPNITANYIEKNNRSKDEYKEIITHVWGWWVSLNWINKRGNYRGEVNMTNNDYGIFKLTGYGWYKGRIIYFEKFATFIYAYRFIGHSDMSDWGYPYVWGITLGNIEWYHEQ